MEKNNFWNELEKEFCISGSEYQKKIEKGEKIPQFSPEYMNTAINNLNLRKKKWYE